MDGTELAIYTVLTTFALLQHADGSRARRVELFLHLAAGLAGLILSKPNISYPAIALCMSVLLIAKISKRFVWGALALAVTASIFLLSTVHLSLFSMLESYKGLANRLVPKMLFLGTFFNISFMEGMAAIPTFAVIAPLCSLVAVLGWRHRRGLLAHPLDLLGFGCIGLAWIGFCTNADAKLTDTPTLLFGSLILVLTASFPTGQLRSRLLWTSCGLLYLAFFAGLTRERMQTIGMWGDEGCGPRVVLHDRFFGTFHNCKPFVSVLSEIDQAVLSLPPGSRVFFGTDLEFSYARNHIASPAHLPLWWHDGTSFPHSQVHQISRSWIDDKFDRLIFVHGVRINIPQEILDAVERDYVQIPGTTFIDVYRPR